MKDADINAVYQEHAERVYSFLLRLCGGSHLAEDLMQDTFMKAMEKQREWAADWFLLSKRQGKQCRQKRQNLL